MSTDPRSYFFGAQSGNYGRFTVSMDWANPPTQADTDEIDEWFNRLTNPELDPPPQRPAELQRTALVMGEMETTRKDPSNPQIRLARHFVAVERHGQINIDARHSAVNQPETKTRRAMCGNCGARYEITDDPVENHHRAMRHKITCGKAEVDQYSEPQRQELLADFENQPMQRLFRERATAELAAGADPSMLKLTGVSIFSEAPAPTPAREIAAAELGAQASEAIRQMAPAPRRWWQFWRWFE